MFKQPNSQKGLRQIAEETNAPGNFPPDLPFVPATGLPASAPGSSSPYVDVAAETGMHNGGQQTIAPPFALSGTSSKE